MASLLEMHIGPSPLVVHRVHPSPLKCKNKYLMLALREETPVQAVGYIVWMFRWLKKPDDQRPQLRAS